MPISLTKANHTHSSSLSTFSHTRYYTQRTGFSQGHPKQTNTNLKYANKPYQKGSVQWGQSASTWRQGSPKLTIPRAERFKTVESYSLDIIDLHIKDTKSNKSCSLGSGKKKGIPEPILRNAQEKPSPNTYRPETMSEDSRKSSKGKTFGSSWKKYERVHSWHRKDVFSPHFTLENPPAHYEVREKPGKNSKKFTAYKRLKTFTQYMSQIKRQVPGPHYNVGIKERLKNITFGSSKRMDLGAPLNENPGASEYSIPGMSEMVMRKYGKHGKHGQHGKFNQ